jgi:predicted GNAT superfamily acetyltransferase
MSASSPKTANSKIDRRRRRHPRYRSEFQVNVSYIQDDQHKKLAGHCRDLSEAGVGILLAAELSNGDVVGLGFSLPGSTLFWDVRAVVRYRRGYHYGFEFLALKREQQDFLRNHLKDLEPMD